MACHVDFEALFSFSTDSKSPHVVFDNSCLWISYFDGTKDGKDKITSNNCDGTKISRFDLEDSDIRRMTSNGQGKLFLCCIETQSVKTFDTSTGDIETLAIFDGYPVGIAYSADDDSVIVCDSQCPSYFVYEGGYSRLTKINLSNLERKTVSEDKCHDFISNVSLGLNGDMWTVDYINDSIYLLSSDGKMKSSFSSTDLDDIVLNPLDICCDEKGRAFVICTNSKCLYCFDQDCSLIGTYQLDYIPSSVHVKDNKIWIGNMMEEEVRVLSYKCSLNK